MRSRNVGINRTAKAYGIGTQTVYKILEADNSASVSQIRIAYQLYVFGGYTMFRVCNTP